MKEVLPDRGEELGRLETEEELPEMPDEPPPPPDGVRIGSAENPEFVIAENFIAETPSGNSPVEEEGKPKPKRKKLTAAQKAANTRKLINQLARGA